MIKILLAALLGTLTYFLVGWLVFEALLGSYMSDHTTQLAGFKKDETEASMVMLFLSCAAYALLLSVLMGKYAKITTFGAGLRLGAITGVLVAVMTDSYWFSTTHFFNSLAPVLVDTVAAGVTVGLMGGIIGWFLGNGYQAKG